MNYWIQLRNGVAFEPQAPQWDLIDPETILHWYSQQNRFSNHAKLPYKVGQHIIRGLKDSEIGYAPRPLKIAWSLHDAHEAFTGWNDLAQPAKKHLDSITDGFISRIEHGIDLAIAKRFGIDPELFQHPLIKETDLRMLATEARDLLDPHPRPWAELPAPYDDRICEVYTPIECKCLLREFWCEWGLM